MRLPALATLLAPVLAPPLVSGCADVDALEPDGQLAVAMADAAASSGEDWFDGAVALEAESTVLVASAPVDPFVDRLADVRVEMTPYGSVISAIDADGATLGTFSLIMENDGGVVWLTSDYYDGYAWVALDTDSFSNIVDRTSTLPEGVIESRAAAIIHMIQTEPQERGEWFWCATSVGVATGVCAGAAASGGLLLVGCVAGAAAATCECISAWAVGKGRRKCAE